MILRAGPPGDWPRGRRIVWIAPPPVLDTCHTFIDDDTAPVASVQNIVKRFGTVAAVDDVSSDVRRSEIRAFLACSCTSIHSPKRGRAARRADRHDPLWHRFGSSCARGLCNLAVRARRVPVLEMEV